MRFILQSSAQKELDKLPDKIVLRISKKIYTLRNNLYGMDSQKLEGEQGYRIRIGDYRVIYTIDKIKQLITIVKIAHRREVYR